MDKKSLENFIEYNFGGIIKDSPWEKYPEHLVFRHADNKKWFALIFEASYETLGIKKEGLAQIANFKCDPDFIDTITKKPGILPAYHMNKTHWVTVLLDGSAEDNDIKLLVDMSYALTNKKHTR